MGHLPPSCGFNYILLAVDSASKWVEAKATKTNDFKDVLSFLKTNIFNRFGVLGAIISQDTHFCNRSVEALLRQYGVNHRVAIVYHHRQMCKLRYPIERVKSILKKMVNPGRNN